MLKKIFYGIGYVLTSPAEWLGRLCETLIRIELDKQIIGIFFLCLAVSGLFDVFVHGASFGWMIAKNLFIFFMVSWMIILLFQGFTIYTLRFVAPIRKCYRKSKSYILAGKLTINEYILLRRNIRYYGFVKPKEHETYKFPSGELFV